MQSPYTRGKNIDANSEATRKNGRRLCITKQDFLLKWNQKDKETRKKKHGRKEFDVVRQK